MLCLLRSIGAHRDHFVRHLSVSLSVCPSVCPFGSHTFLVVTHSYVSQATLAFLGMLPLCLYYFAYLRNILYEMLMKCDFWQELYALVSCNLYLSCILKGNDIFVYHLHDRATVLSLADVVELKWMWDPKVKKVATVNPILYLWLHFIMF